MGTFVFALTRPARDATGHFWKTWTGKGTDLPQELEGDYQRALSEGAVEYRHDDGELFFGYPAHEFAPVDGFPGPFGGLPDRLSSEGIECSMELPIDAEEYCWRRDLVGRVRPDVDATFGEPGAEVFRRHLCLGCMGRGRSMRPICYVEGYGHTCNYDGVAHECCCPDKDCGPCSCCGGKGWEEGSSLHKR